MKKYEIILVNLNPTKGSEQQGTRPCIVIQNNLANSSKLKTIAIAPLTTNIKETPYGVIIDPSGKNGLSQKSRIELSQIRVIDKSRKLKILGVLEREYHPQINEKISDFFDIMDEWAE